MQNATDTMERHSRDMASALLVLFKTSMVYDLSNAVLHKPMENYLKAVNAIAEEHGGSETRFLGDMVYVNRVLVRPDSALFSQVRSINKILNKLKLKEIVTVGTITTEDLLQFLSAVKEAMNHPNASDVLRQTSLENIKFKDIVESQGQSELSPQMKALRSYIATLFTIRDLIARIEQQKDVSIAPTKRATRDLVSMVYAEEQTMLGLIQMRQHRGKPFHRLVNCAVLVSAMCKRLKLDRVSAAETALGASLHDLDWSGNSDHHTSIRHLVRIYRSDRIGLLRVCVTGDVGNPQGLGTSRLISVAERYERLTSIGERQSNGSMKRLMPDEALRQIESQAGKEFDELAVKLLINTLGIFPIGTTVQLASGEICIVVELPDDGRNISQPVVKIVKNAQGQPADGRLLDLTAYPDAQIVRSVEPDAMDLNVTHFFLA